MSSAIITYTGPAYLPQERTRKEPYISTPQRRPTARTIEIKHQEREGTEDGTK